MRIIIADEHQRVRYALGVLLRHQPGWSIVGTVTHLEKLPDLVSRTGANMLLLDWEMSGFSTALVTELRNRNPDLIIVAMGISSHVRQAATSWGVNAYVSKMDPPTRLLEVIQGAVVGQVP